MPEQACKVARPAARRVSNPGQRFRSGRGHSERGPDLNQRPPEYGSGELPSCSTPLEATVAVARRNTKGPVSNRVISPVGAGLLPSSGPFVGAILVSRRLWMVRSGLRCELLPHRLVGSAISTVAQDASTQKGQSAKPVTGPSRFRLVVLLLTAYEVVTEPRSGGSGPSPAIGPI